ncbi:octopamine receptor beta-1R [Nematostella vectensis]|uniref:octopamine receptor beta-1R n=1 Tax=Nematostella vectensis TaxID=45351 RepID=UPI00138FAC5E|nr:octopamine receptor beta-1R [Nematostella vectensis]XP_032232918.1 octopamine receptor beta-1R [Nematostella vectensis]XP_032232919.1 octopamine receptor beta-1R [Nematostella vectensis]XP_032232920.1 octopamine receptor beta-1R [Nematostella vectensis]XP_032232921.1 octopamine receptor beta-1R [Nematostella vectensis]XP_032232922.1 octopamine receptor beta-1R [Nematostella vectensis]XP_032232923.1 octopamine receptor beta-1R [Nematostella vectensis]
MWQNNTGTNASSGREESRGQGLNHVELVLFLVFASLLVIVTIINNLLVILGAWSNPRLRRGTYSIFVSLAVSDVLVGAVSMPLWIYMVASGAQMSRNLFLLYIVFDIFSAMASILHLAGVSVERFMAISRPTKYMLLTQKPYKNAIIIMWLLAALIACLFPIQTTFQWSTIFTLMMFSFGFIIPLIIISSMYITIFKISKKVIVPIERRVSSDDLKRQMRKEHQLARTGALVTGLFFVGWLPFFVVSLIGNFCPPCLKPYPGFDLKLTAFVKFMHYGNSMMNTFVYAFLNTEMRRTFSRLLRHMLERMFQPACPAPVQRAWDRTQRWRKLQRRLQTT